MANVLDRRRWSSYRRATLKPVPLSTRPTVTVVVPCYNYGRYLDALMASLADQGDVEVDVIIVDDASGDGSAEVVRRIAAETPWVTAVCHERNMGHIATYNDGLARATGTYVVLLSADDLLPPKALSRAVALMEAHPNVGFVYGYAQSFTGSLAPPVRGEVRNWSVWAGHNWLGRSARTGRCVVVSPEVVMRRAAFEQSGGYDPRLPHSADFHMWMRTAVNWDVGRVNGPAQALYRVHDQNMHLTTYAGWLADLQARLVTFDILFAENLGPNGHLRHWNDSARRALAREAMRLNRSAQHAGDHELAGRYRQFATECGDAGRSEEHRRALTRSAAVLQQRHVARVIRHLRWRWERRYG